VPKMPPKNVRAVKKRAKIKGSGVYLRIKRSKKLAIFWIMEHSLKMICLKCHMYINIAIAIK
jgi:hypothetical protein